MNKKRVFCLLDNENPKKPPLFVLFQPTQALAALINYLIIRNMNYFHVIGGILTIIKKYQWNTCPNEPHLLDLSFQILSQFQAYQEQ